MVSTKIVITKFREKSWKLSFLNFNKILIIKDICKKPRKWIIKFQLFKFWNPESVGVNKKYFSENSILRNLPSGQNMRTSVVGQINSSVKCVWAAYFWALVGRKCAPLESRKTWAHPGTLTFFCKQPQKL